MLYLIVLLALWISLLVYFKLADYYNIIDKPNQRSSHIRITIRGGGIVFPFAILLYAVLFNQVSTALLLGMMFISIASFLDDIKSLSNRIRFLVHLLAVTALLWSVDAFTIWNLWSIPVVYILIIGIINAYNFMDGINGITGVYSLVTLVGLWYVNTFIQSFVDKAFIICPVIACLVFLWFNFRKRAKCFAGDVGSISIGFWLIALLLMAIIRTGNLEYVLFLSVYGVDTVLTILHRLLLKQNIFAAHRLHFYQLLANECQVPHLWVASAYGLVQLLVNVLITGTSLGFLSTFLWACVPLVLLYLLAKPRLMAKKVWV